MISVIVPVKNGADTLGRCLQSLHEQTVKDLDIIIFDSESTDNSVAIAKKFGATVYNIPASTFNHGLTRNDAVKIAKGEFCFFTVQDAWLAEIDMLQKMADHFKDAEVMGVVGHQAVPHEKDKNPLLWFKRFSEPHATKRKVDDWVQFKKMPQEQQQALVAWDNVVAMYRRTALIEQPFVATEFAEDWIWSEHALKRGWTLIHDPSLVTWHYHHRDFAYSFKVAYAVNYHFFLLLNYRPRIPALFLPMLKASYHILKNQSFTIQEKWYWITHNYAGIWGNFLSHVNFLIRLRVGGTTALRKAYYKYCTSIPQGKQKND